MIIIIDYKGESCLEILVKQLKHTRMMKIDVNSHCSQKPHFEKFKCNSHISKREEMRKMGPSKRNVDSLHIYLHVHDDICERGLQFRERTPN